MNNDIITELIDELEKDQLINSLLRYHMSQTRQEEQNIVDLTCVPLSINLKYIYDRQTRILTVKGKKSEIMLKILSNKHVTYATYDEVYPNVLQNIAELLYFAIDENNATLAPVPFSDRSENIIFAYCVLLNAIPIYYPNAEDINITYLNVERLLLDIFAFHRKDFKRFEEVINDNKPRVHYLVSNHVAIDSLDVSYFEYNNGKPKHYIVSRSGAFSLDIFYFDYDNEKTSNLRGLADVLNVHSMTIMLHKYYVIK